MNIIPEEDKNILIQTLESFHNICEEYSFKYWVCGGTFLGAVREKGFIKWDYDVDVCVMHKDISDLWCILSELKSKGYSVSLTDYWFDGIIKIAHPKTTMQKLVLDIFTMRENGDIVESSSEFSRNRWKNWYYGKGELFPLKKYKFEDFTVYGPATDAILRRHYGDYEKPVYHEDLKIRDDSDKNWLKRKIIPVNDDGSLRIQETIISY